MREKFATRTIYLRGKQQEEILLNLIPNLPFDAENPLQVVIREPVDVRSNEQNKLYQAVMAEQIWIAGRNYSHQVWGEHCKQAFLPEFEDETLVKTGYKKWVYLTNGDKRLVGSTTDLKIKGMTRYLDEVIKFAVEQGVTLSEDERM